MGLKIRILPFSIWFVERVAVSLVGLILINYMELHAMGIENYQLKFKYDRWTLNSKSIQVDNKSSKKEAIVKYPKLNPLLANQLSAIPPSLYDKVNYYPSSVELNSGEILENVLLVVAGEYYSSWGVWPHEDSSKEEINLGNIKYVFPSRNRIPLQFSQKIISYEESGMGYSLFYFVFKDGNKVLSLCGGICDFFVLPDSYLVEDIIDVQPFARDNNQPIVPIIKTANFYFCLYDE